MKELTQKYLPHAIGFLLLVILVVAYSNHFDNGFYFDDTHTIVNNSYIRDISLIPQYFTDIKYYGTMAGNQGYNPMLVTLNAIDYWLGDGLEPHVFHSSIFVSYVLLLLALFIFSERLFLSTNLGKKQSITIVAVLTTGFYGLHASNAETINYIIMRFRFFFDALHSRIFSFIYKSCWEEVLSLSINHVTRDSNQRNRSYVRSTSPNIHHAI